MTTTERLRELLAKATPGPWAVHTHANWKIMDSKRWLVADIAWKAEEGNHQGESSDNAALIVAAINALPALLEALNNYQYVAEVATDQWGGDYLWEKWGLSEKMKQAQEALANLDKETL
jgi:hypothetical protein